MFQAMLILAASFVTAPGPARQSSGILAYDCTWVTVPKEARPKLLEAVRAGLGAAALRTKSRIRVSCRVEALGTTYLFTLSGSCGQIGPNLTVKGSCEVCRLAEAVSSLRKTAAKLGRRLKETCVVPTRVIPHEPRESLPPPRVELPRPKPVQASRPRRRPSRTGLALKVSGIVVSGLSVAGIAAGAALVAIHGKGTCDSPGQCPEVYDTKVPGIAVLAVSGATLAAGISLYVVGYLKGKRAKKESSVSWDVAPGSIQFTWSF